MSLPPETEFNRVARIRAARSGTNVEAEPYTGNAPAYGPSVPIPNFSPAGTTTYKENRPEVTWSGNEEVSPLSVGSINTSRLGSSFSNDDMKLIPYLSHMKADEIAIFREQIDEIRRLRQEELALAQASARLDPSLQRQSAALQALGQLPRGDPSFRGATEPTFYLGTVKNSTGKNTVGARINYTVDGFPYRSTHPTSFNAALANMKQKVGRVSGTSKSVKAMLNAVNSRKRNQIAKAAQIKKLVDKLEADYDKWENTQEKARREQRAKLKQQKATVRGTQPLMQGTAVGLTPTAYEAASTVVARPPPAAPAAVPWYKRNPFSRSKATGGKSRKNNSRKNNTRKARRNTRR